jgi:hypothetical protein
MSEAAATTPATTDTSGVPRTPDGTIASQTQTTTPAATTAQTSTTPTETPSLLNQGQEGAPPKPAEGTPPGAPETYTQFTVPEGYTLDPATMTEATAIFKKLNLPQAQAQELVNFYVAKSTESANEPYKVWNDMQEKWVTEIKADPQLGPKLDTVKTTISKAIDGMGDPKLARDFREAMDFTGAGNNPAFIRAFYKLAQMVTEGGHVAGKGPSPQGQGNQGQPPSAARAMYPNLP